MCRFQYQFGLTRFQHLLCMYEFQSICTDSSHNVPTSVTMIMIAVDMFHSHKKTAALPLHPKLMHIGSVVQWIPVKYVYGVSLGNDCNNCHMVTEAKRLKKSMLRIHLKQSCLLLLGDFWHLWLILYWSAVRRFVVRMTRQKPVEAKSGFHSLLSRLFYFYFIFPFSGQNWVGQGLLKYHDVSMNSTRVVHTDFPFSIFHHIASDLVVRVG